MTDPFENAKGSVSEPFAFLPRCHPGPEPGSRDSRYFPNNNFTAASNC